MQTQIPKTDVEGLQAALAHLEAIVRDGLRHGFFECVVSSETISANKRRLVIKAGKSHRFVVPLDEVLR